MNACDVLNQVLQGTGMPPGEPERYGGDNGCRSTAPQKASVSVYLIPDRKYDELNAELGKQHRGDIEGRPAIQIREGVNSEGGCDISMQVAGDSRVFVSVTNDETDQACQLAEELATKIDPLLPEA